MHIRPRFRMRTSLENRQIQSWKGFAIIFAICVEILSLCGVRRARAAEPLATDATTTRYGPMSLFDARSNYGVGTFPEPFLVDDSDLEQGEYRLDWIHQENRGARFNTLNTEIEKGFGLVTLEVEGHYEYDSISTFDPASGGTDHSIQQAFQNMDLGARAPFFQYVSKNGFFDTTFGTGIEVGIPLNTQFSKSAEIVPKIFNDTQLGEHVTIQSIFGYSMLLGGAPEGGVNTFEYGFDFGYTLDHEQLPLPGIESVIPVFELSGATQVNHQAAGVDSLFGDAAVRVNLRAIGNLQPRLGIGYIFPIDQGARDDSRWGIITSIVIEF
jgi:hypothetical protein